jgi:hypothetical protein
MQQRKRKAAAPPPMQKWGGGLFESLNASKRCRTNAALKLYTPLAQKRRVNGPTCLNFDDRGDRTLPDGRRDKGKEKVRDGYDEEEPEKLPERVEWVPPILPSPPPLPPPLPPPPPQPPAPPKPRLLASVDEVGKWLVQHPDQIVGNETVRNKLIQWCAQSPTEKGYQRLAVVSGPSGSGKTLGVEVALMKAGYTMVYVSVPSLESAGLSKKSKPSALGDPLLLAFDRVFDSERTRRNAVKQRREMKVPPAILVLDDLDACTKPQWDRIAKGMKEYPSTRVIGICGHLDRYQVVRQLKVAAKPPTACLDMSLSTPPQAGISKFLATVLPLLQRPSRSLPMDPDRLASLSQGDVRSALQSLFLGCAAGVVDKTLDSTSAVATLMQCSSHLPAGIDRAEGAYSVNSRAMTSLLEYNVMLRYKYLGGSNNKMHDMQMGADFLDALSEADAMEGQLEWRSEQDVDSEAPSQLRAVICGVRPLHYAGYPSSVGPPRQIYWNKDMNALQSAVSARTNIEVAARTITSVDPTRSSPFCRLDLFPCLQGTSLKALYSFDLKTLPLPTRRCADAACWCASKKK